MFGYHAIFVDSESNSRKHWYFTDTIIQCIVGYTYNVILGDSVVGKAQSMSLLGANTVYQHQTVIQHHVRQMSKTVMLIQYW